MYEVVNKYSSVEDITKIAPVIPEIKVVHVGNNKGSKVTADHPVFSRMMEEKSPRNPLERDLYLDTRQHIYDFREILEAEDVDSYVRSTFRLTVETAMRQGYKFTGKNPELVRLIEKRHKIIARKSRTNLYSMIEQAASSLTKFNNCFFVISRLGSKSFETSVFKPYRHEGKVLNPIGGLFYTEPQHMFPELDNGRIVKWHYENTDTGAMKLDIPPEDVIHIYWDKKGDSILATPWILPALDDVRILRRMEEYMGVLIEKNLFPLYQYKVGSKDKPAVVAYDEGGSSEVQSVEAAMGGILPTQGVVFTSERHEVLAIDSKSPLDLSKYLEYTEKRALAGCMLSEVELGRGATANKGTATTINKNRVNTCTRLHMILTSFWNDLVTYSLLKELGVDPYDATNAVYLEFNDIDTEEQRARETHSIQKWSANGITHPELRLELGEKPLEDDDGWQGLHMNVVGLATAEMGQQAEASKIASQAAVANKVSPKNQTNPAGKVKPKVAKND